jgi:hypothetical protein
MRTFHPSEPLLARPNAAQSTPSLLDRFNAWMSGGVSGGSSEPAQAPVEPPKPSTPDGKPVAKGTAAYAAILAELERKYGKFPANAVGYRDAVGDGNYVYRQYSDGRIFIQKSGMGSAPVPPKVVDAKAVPTTGGGLPPWVLPVSIVGGAVAIGAGIYFWPKIRSKMRRR